MMATNLAGRTHRFADLRTLLACASPDRAGDRLAGLAAESRGGRVAARIALAGGPLTRFFPEPLIDPETDEVSRLILDQHQPQAFAPVASYTVGEFRASCSAMQPIHVRSPRWRPASHRKWPRRCQN